MLIGTNGTEKAKREGEELASRRCLGEEALAIQIVWGKIGDVWMDTSSALGSGFQSPSAESPFFLSNIAHVGALRSSLE